MIIAGIDEAGLGPNLGPLVVSTSGFWLDDDLYDIENTSLWEVFSAFTTGKRTRGDKRLLIADSKIAYKVKGMEGLRDTVLNFIKILHPDIRITNLTELLCLLGMEAHLDTISDTYWYKNSFSKDLKDNRLLLSDETYRDISVHKVNPVLFRTKILTARKINDMYSRGLNKSEILLSQSGEHIKHLIDSYPDEKIKITVDKQGGKTYYAPYLIDLLDGAWVDVIREGADSSLYRVGANIHIEFLPKADQKEFTVSLASIISKFLREILMDDFNNFFAALLPELKPTAGYPTDAKRFIKEISDILDQKKIEISSIWRER